MQDTTSANIVLKDSLDLMPVVIIIGIILGIILAYFFLKKAKGKYAMHNSYLGFIMIVFVLIFTEGYLNYTLYILKFSWLSKFSEPINFLIAPLIYLFTIERLGDSRGYRDRKHFIPAIFWFVYCFFYYTQTSTFKSYYLVEQLQLNLKITQIDTNYSIDPLSIRDYFWGFVIIQMLFYFVLIYKGLCMKAKEIGCNKLYKIKNNALTPLHLSTLLYLVFIVISIYTMFNYKHRGDDYYLYLYVTICFMLFTLRIMFKSALFHDVSALLDPGSKYKHSSLNDDKKTDILKAILHQMHEEKYFLSNMASLTDLSKKISETPHNVSQVINEKLNQSFFELLALCRINEAKTILKTDLGKKLTIEEIANLVGYNSKSGFNTAFKKITSQTPSEFRSSQPTDNQ